MGELVSFVGVSVLVIVTPGPDTALTIRNALRGGRAGGIATALGVASGQAAWTLATSAGLAALLVASAPAFTALRLVGAAYLVYLGVEALLRALRRSNDVGGARDLGRARLRARAAYRQGLLSNLSNPKMAAFFTSLLPQFVAADGAAFAPLLALGLLFATLTLVWLSAYAVVVARARAHLRGTRLQRALDAATGAVLVAIGLRLGVSTR